jgi:hypothetical protein
VRPATSPWTVLITAAAAFFGVVVAQWWTTRREDRNWQRQLQMYAHQWEDQRQRDAEQREDQRQRDRELWAREDKHRFIEHKRSLYGDTLGLISDVHQVTLRAMRDVGQEGKDAKLDPAMADRLRAVTGQLYLLAPAKIANRAIEIQSSLLNTAWYALASCRPGESDELLGTIMQLVSTTMTNSGRLRHDMREDLAVSDDLHANADES